MKQRFYWNGEEESERADRALTAAAWTALVLTLLVFLAASILLYLGR